MRRKIETNKNNNMKRILLLPLMLITAVVAQAEVTSLRVEKLTGDELTASLAQIGKIVLGEDDVLVYDKSGTQIGSASFSQFGKIVFFADGSTATSDVAASSVKVFYDTTRESLLVRGIEGLQTVRVYAANGQLLQSADVENGEAVMHIGGLQNGAYLLQAGAQVVKFIKE